MNIKARIYITLKSTVSDPQGMTVKGGLHQLGFTNVNDVRIGKFIELEVTAESVEMAELEVTDMCDKLLANMIIEEYTFKLES
jgi:phosphoribosylformylglycinamidine synthase PurS subunit